MAKKAKFRVGQVVCIRPCTFDKIHHMRERDGVIEYTCAYFEKNEHSMWWPEERLRPLTKREASDGRK